MPITLNFGSHGSSTEKYYLIHAIVGSRRDAFQVILPKDTVIDLGNNQLIKNSNEVVVKIDPRNPTQTTTLTKGTLLKYTSSYDIWYGYQKTTPNYFDVNGANWLTTARYAISTYNNNALMSSQDVNVNYQSPQEINLGNIYVENLGILPNGLSVPSGDYVVAQDKSSTYKFYRWDSLNTIVSRFNDYVDIHGLSEWGLWSPVVTWQNVIDKMSSLGYQFNPETTQGTVSISYLGTEPNKVTLTLPTGSYSGEILIYVPQSVADGIIIIKQQSKGVITSAPDIPTIDENHPVGYSVRVKNVGSSDYIGVSMSCNNYNVNGNTRVLFNENEEKTFPFTLTALETTTTTRVPCTVLADGTALSGGDDTKTVYGTINNVANPTPTSGTTPVPNTINAEFINWYDTPQAVLLLFTVITLIFLLYYRRKQ
ncbi:MAG: hypothetical protein WC623_21660 [Pedobacter sp.]|uniref:hypothetical protein n=1 Tax=Pedobacter sp. TaxID=1411316 RepID=UPI00356188BC